MVRNRVSQLDNLEICRECLVQTNNNPKEALKTLSNAFQRAGAGSPSESLKHLLIQEATDQDSKFERSTAIDESMRTSVLGISPKLVAAKIKGGSNVFRLDNKTGAYVNDRVAIIGAPPTLQQKVDSLFTDMSIPGAVCLIKNGDVIAKSFADGIDSDTQFEIASLTKQFTAMAILKLVETEKLSLDANIATFFDDFPHGNDITVRQLLNMTSGLPRHMEYKDESVPISSEGTLKTISEQVSQEKNLLFTPGSKMLYSNINYQLLTLIIEKQSGKSYDEFLSEAIFEPLGMKGTGVAFDPDREQAEGYQLKNGQSEKAFQIHHSVSSGSGCLKSTMSDLIKWQKCMLDLRKGDSSFIDSNLFSKMTTPNNVPEFNNPDQLSNYGFGIHVLNDTGHEHPGRLPGASALLQHIDGVDLLYISNYSRLMPEAVSEAVRSLIPDSSTKISHLNQTDLTLNLFRRYKVLDAMPHFKKCSEDIKLDEINLSHKPFYDEPTSDQINLRFLDYSTTNYFKAVSDDPSKANPKDIQLMLNTLNKIKDKVPKDSKDDVQKAIFGLRAMLKKQL